VKNLVPVQIWHPPCNLPHDQCGHSFCERWALVVVLLHHHLYWWASIPLAISLMISVAIRFGKGRPWLLLCCIIILMSLRKSLQHFA
jgi:hypothetical protein